MEVKILGIRIWRGKREVDGILDFGLDLGTDSLDGGVIEDSTCPQGLFEQDDRIAGAPAFNLFLRPIRLARVCHGVAAIAVGQALEEGRLAFFPG